MDEENREIIEKKEEPKSTNQQPPTFSDPDGTGVRFYSMAAAKELNKKSKLKKSLIGFGIILAVLLVIGVVSTSFDMGTMSGTSNMYPSDPYIAKLYVEGVISAAGSTDYFGTPIGYQHQWTLDTIDELMWDENNQGLILFVDSPGGGVYESDELYFKIKEYQEFTGRPVYSAMGTMAASGGYYISAPCDKIIANRNCWTGSIGVTMGTMFDFSGFLERYGVKTNTLSSGANKSMGSSVDPMTDEQRQIFQSLIDEAYNQFIGLVAEGRNMKIERVRQIADGRIYTAKQALDLGLIDGIGTVDEAIWDMQESYELEYCDVEEIVYQESSIFGSLLGSIKIPSLGAGSDAAVILKLAEQSSQFPVSYMCEALR